MKRIWSNIEVIVTMVGMQAIKIKCYNYGKEYGKLLEDAKKIDKYTLLNSYVNFNHIPRKSVCRKS